MTATSIAHRSDFHAALADIAPAMVAAVPMGLLYGALAVAKGMSPLETTLASALIFAGGAQFAAIEIWTYPVPVWALVLSTALINARHILMGASLAPKLAGFTRAQRFLGFYALADENWALAERRAMAARVTPGYFLSMAAVFWLNWVAWSTLGAVLGPALGDPARLGADFAFTAIFIALIVSFCRGRHGIGVVAASAVTAALVRVMIGSPWHVLAGAIAGIAAAALLHREPERS
jgi:4-azaleucine resistance transporter AzlC